MPSLFSVPPRSLEKALAHVKSGGRLYVRTMTHVTVVDAKVLARFQAGGHWLLKEDGQTYRLRSGKGSVYLLPGQLESDAEILAAEAESAAPAVSVS